MTSSTTLQKKKTSNIKRSKQGIVLDPFFDLTKELLCITNQDGTFINSNTAFEEATGYSKKQLEKMVFLDLVHSEDKAALRQFMQEKPLSGQVIDFEARMVGKDGEILWIDWRKQNIKNFTYNVGQDITAIKKHEQALERREQQLSEAEAIGRMGHWHWTIGHEQLELSDEIYRIFGVKRDEFNPTLDNVNAMLHRRDVGRMVQAFQRAIIEQNAYDMDFRIIRPDGDIRYVRCEGRCEKDNEGDVIALFGIMQDVTETMLHECDLRDAKEAAERAYAAKSQFLANMSHELRTPLNAIIGFSEMMQRQLLGPIGTEKYLDYIAGIRESGEHLLDLISDILDMSKIEAEKYELALEEVNVSKLIKLALHMMEGRALDESIKLLSQIENENRQIIVDRRALMQILLNLLSNAVKFSNENGRVTVSVNERDDYLTIIVKDEGIGIPANKLRYITRPFEQAASHYTRNHEGSGLGLAITKELIELHGGTLHIESVVEVGTTVTVRLPYDASKTRQDRKKETDKKSLAA